MLLATWNVNSLRARLENVDRWIRSARPDVLLLQEIKCTRESFPWEYCESWGYNIALVGQKSYNGVAILSKSAIDVVQESLHEGDSSARFLHVLTAGMHVINVYVPNGQVVHAPAFEGKRLFMSALTDYVQELCQAREDVVMGGDFNIAPTDEDVALPHHWHEQVLCTSQERMWLRRLINVGLSDALDIAHLKQALLIQKHDNDEEVQMHAEIGPKERFRPWTWWDYRGRAFDKDEGLRIDHILLNSSLTKSLERAGVDRRPRSWDKASDHAPVWVQLA